MVNVSLIHKTNILTPHIRRTMHDDEDDEIVFKEIENSFDEKFFEYKKVVEVIKKYKIILTNLKKSHKAQEKLANEIIKPFIQGELSMLNQIRIQFNKIFGEVK